MGKKKEEEKPNAEEAKATDDTQPGEGTLTPDGGPPLNNAVPDDEGQSPDENILTDVYSAAADDDIKAEALLNALKKSVTDKIAEAEKEPGPFRKVKDFLHRMYGNAHVREFNKFVGERCMDFIRFAAKNKNLFVEIISLTAIEIRDRTGKFELDDIDELIESAIKNALNIIDTDSNAVEFNVEWIEMAVRILIFILKNTGKLG